MMFPRVSGWRDGRMAVYCEGVTRFRHFEGGGEHQRAPQEIQFEEVERQDREMSPEITYLAKGAVGDWDVVVRLSSAENAPLGIVVPVGRDQENRGRLRRKIFVLARRYATLDKIKTDHRSQHKSTASQLLDREPFVKDGRRAQRQHPVLSNGATASGGPAARRDPDRPEVPGRHVGRPGTRHRGLAFRLSSQALSSLRT